MKLNFLVCPLLGVTRSLRIGVAAVRSATFCSTQPFVSVDEEPKAPEDVLGSYCAMVGWMKRQGLLEQLQWKI